MSMSCTHLFPTIIYKKSLANKQNLNSQLFKEILLLSKEDTAGITWSSQNYPGGFTSYASANQMHKMSPTFADLEKIIYIHVLKYTANLKLNLKANQLQMTTCWVNIMGPHCSHTAHNHPHSVVSGTYYIEMPKNASAIKFEDPRYNHFMARPPLKPNTEASMQTHYSLPAKAGDLILFESWLKHSVPTNLSKKQRISISFNY